MLRTNKLNLVMKSVLGTISFPRVDLKNPYLVDSSGKAQILPGTGGITYNVSVGDSALDFAADHVEPGVSITLSPKEADNSSLGGLSILTCIGNEARVVSGSAAGARGVVTGKHGGVEHVIIDFSPAVLDRLVIGDKIQIKTFGQGLKLKDFPELHVMNTDPSLLRKLGIVTQNKQLVVPVTHMIPASIMGSGLGSKHSMSGDYDIQITDRNTLLKYGLQNLRIGDVIAITDADCRFGRSIRTGAMTIGVIVHASCITNGHGPGVTVLMTTAKKLIVPRIEETANLANYLETVRARRKRGSRRYKN